MMDNNNGDCSSPSPLERGWGEDFFVAINVYNSYITLLFFSWLVVKNKHKKTSLQSKLQRGFNIISLKKLL